MARLQSRSRTRAHSRKRSRPRRATRSRKRSPNRRSGSRKRSKSRSRSRKRSKSRSRSRKRSRSKRRSKSRKRSRSRRRSKSRSKSGLSQRRTRSRSRGSRPSGLPIPEDTEPPTQRLPPKDRKGMSPKQLGHGVSTEWIKDTFIVKIKRRDGTTIKFIPPLAIMTGVSKKTGKPTTRRIGMNDLDSLTKKQQEILSRY